MSNLDEDRPFEPYRSYSKTDLALSKLDKKLKAQAGSSTLNLSDAFIGDEGCEMIAEFLNANPQLVNLELRGNNLTVLGLRALAPALRQLSSLKVLSLEWNSIENGVGVLVDAIAFAPSLRVLDLRNNKMGSESGLSLARLLENSRSLQRLDLRWNEIGSSGASHILGALKNSSVESIELAGNRISEDILQEIEGKAPRSPPPRFETSPLRETSPRYELPPPPVEEDNLYAKYESAMLVNARYEARTHELELQMEQDMKKAQELRGDLIREIEAEKAKRAYTEEALALLKEESFKREMEDNRVRQELESRLAIANKEKGQLKIELDAKQDEMDKSQYSMHEKLRSLEEQLLQTQRQGKVNDEGARQALEKARIEHTQEVEENAREFRFRLDSAEENIKQLSVTKESLESENKALRTQINKLKASHQEEMSSQEFAARQSETEKINNLMKNFESRLRESEDNREMLNRKNQELKREGLLQQQQSADKAMELESALRFTRDENSDFKRQLQKANENIDELRSHVMNLENNLDRANNEKEELTRVLQERNQSHMQKLEQVYQEQAAERLDAENAKSSLTHRLDETQEELSKTAKEREMVLSEYAVLSETLKKRAAAVLEDSFAAHVRNLTYSFTK